MALVTALLAIPLSNCGSGDVETPDKNGDKKNSDGGEDKSSSTTGSKEEDKSSSTKGNDSSGDTTDKGSNTGNTKPKEGKIDCSKLKPTGIKVGNVAPNVSLKDAKGNTVNLHDYCNEIVYVMAGSAF